MHGEMHEEKMNGGEELDTELKNILMTLKKENASSKSSISGGKRRKSKKSSKKSSRRSDMSAVSDDEDETSMMNSDVDTDNEDYLSTSSLNTSDINVKHYR
jgi:hypothetical protein